MGRNKKYLEGFEPLTSAEVAAEAKAEKTAYPFFTLSPSKLAGALGKLMGITGAGTEPSDLDPDQQLYARAVLLNTASASTALMAEETKFPDEHEPNKRPLDYQRMTQARKAAPAAYGMTMVGKYEGSLYQLIEDGDVEGVKSTTKHQVATVTTHPNFSRSKELVDTCHELTEALGKLDRPSQEAVQKGGGLTGAIGARAASLLGKMKPALEKRDKRSRHAELKETVLDFIPTAMKAATEQVNLFKKRRAALQGKPLTFTGTNQLEAMAALLPEYNSWFVDGDGKRTCHVYDAELAIPAIKKATYKHYLELLEKLPGEIGNLNAEVWKGQLNDTITVLEKVEGLAMARMEAISKMQKAYDSSASNLEDFKTTARIAGEAYNSYKNTKVTIHKIDPTTGESIAESVPVIKLLQNDDALELRQQLGAALNKVYDPNDPIKLKSDKQKEAAEDLYIKLTAYGNFAVRLQRRENAKEYRETLEYLIQSNKPFTDQLYEKLRETIPDLRRNDMLTNFELEPQFVTKAVEAFAQLVSDPSTSAKIKESIFGLKGELPQDQEQIGGSYMFVRDKLECTPNDKSKDKRFVITPLQPREFVTLDALGYFNIARLYPEAFKGGFVTAEFAQPDDTVLQKGDEKLIKSEVIRRAKTDMLLQIAFARAMGAIDKGRTLDLIPLYEDPKSMRYAAEAQAALRENDIVRDYMLHFIGINGQNETEKAAIAERKALKRFKNGSGYEELTAYDIARSNGFSDKDLQERYKFSAEEINDLKHTFVLEGPYDMEACSDNSKRAGIIGAELAQQAIREKTIEAMRKKNIVRIGDKQYVIIKPKYLGQGGSIARATEIPLDTVQATLQGEHQLSFVPKSLAYKMAHFLLGRLYLTNEAARGELPSDVLYQLASGKAFHAGNMLGLPGHAMTEKEKILMHETIQARLESTQNDKLGRYNAWLDKYGEPTVNFSARDDNKDAGRGEIIGKKPDFAKERAIGVAAKEAGIFSNVIGLAAMFDPEKGNANRIRQWLKNDPSLQHRFTAAALILNYVNLKEKWAHGNIDYNAKLDSDGYLEETLTKGNVTVPLRELTKAYIRNQTECTKDGETFDAADLVMAHLTWQYRELEKGLHKVYPDPTSTMTPEQRKKYVQEQQEYYEKLKEHHPKGRFENLSFFDKAHHEDILATQNLYDGILERLRETKHVPDELDETKPHTEEEEKSINGRKLLKGAYHLIFESGGGIFPMPALLEQGMHSAEPKYAQAP